MSPYFPARLENVVRSTKLGTASEIADAIKADVRAFAEPQDDITIVVIKRR